MIGRVHDGPAGRTLPIDPGMSHASAAAFAEGGDDHDFAAVIDNGLPIFAFALDQPEAFARPARRFPQLGIIVEHCGVFSNSMRPTVGEGLAACGRDQQLALFEEVCALAEFPMSRSRGHSSGMFDLPVWPAKACGRSRAGRLMPSAPSG